MIDDSIKLKYLELLGQITIEFNDLEQELHEAIHRLSGLIDLDVAERITAGENFQGLHRLFNALFRYRITSPKQLQRLDDLNKRLDGNDGKIAGVNTKRNDLLHGPWMITDAWGLTGAVKWKRAKTNLKKYKSEYRMIEISELQEFVSEVYIVKTQLHQLMNDNEELIRDHIEAFNQLWLSTGGSMEVINKFYEKHKEEKQQR